MTGLAKELEVGCDNENGVMGNSKVFGLSKFMILTFAFFLPLGRADYIMGEFFSCIASASGWPFTFGGQGSHVFSRHVV